jgi:Icc-related predicted phosphoesterase
MKLLAFSDIHGDRAALERLMAMEADFYVAAGDLTNWARGFEPLGETLARRAPRVWVLPGNHEHASQIASFCLQYGLNPLHGKSFLAGPWHIAGFGHSNPTPFNTPGEESEEEIARHLEPFATLQPMVLICHCPPNNTPLDEATPGRHLGSTAVAEFVRRVQPAWFLCGHIHEASGRSAELGRTKGVNVGKRGYLLEL